LGSISVVGTPCLKQLATVKVVIRLFATGNHDDEVWQTPPANAIASTGGRGEFDAARASAEGVPTLPTYPVDAVDATDLGRGHRDERRPR
jgi:hypothetical protein